MPIYEYRCKICGATSEYLMGVGKDENIFCKECGSAVTHLLALMEAYAGVDKRPDRR